MIDNKPLRGSHNIGTFASTPFTISISGTTAKQCIDKFMVLKMNGVLATSNNSIQELSDKFGFDEPTNFINYFKKTYRLLPYTVSE
jgi:AraC-like DNA-binding protein